MTAIEQPILILTAFKPEARLLAAILPDCRQSDASNWTFKGGKLTTANAAGGDALLALLDFELSQADYLRIILFGAAGALVPELKIGQVYACDSLFYAGRKMALPFSKEFPTASVVTVDQPVTTKEDRIRLAENYHAQLVDMESFFFAEALHDRGLSGAVIRFVSDTAEQAFRLPFPETVKSGITDVRGKLYAIISQF